MAFQFVVSVICFLMLVLHRFCEADTSPSVVAEIRNLQVDSRGEVDVDVLLHNVTDTSSLFGLEVVLIDFDIPDEAKHVMLNSTHQALDMQQKKYEDFFYTITGLKQDTIYTLFFQINDSALSCNYSLVTTGLQSLVVLSDTEVGCVFLPGARADGCLLKWSSDQGSGEVIVNRHKRNVVSVKIPLGPGSYELLGYGLLENNTLHSFPVKLQYTLEVKSTEVIEEQSTESNVSRSLIINISAALSSILVGIVVLLCIVLTIMKCRARVHLKMKKDLIMENDTESIQTSPNICYEGILELDRSPARQDDISLHLYDDVVGMFTVDYENVNTFPRKLNPSLLTCSQPSRLKEPQQSNPVVIQQHISTTEETCCQLEEHVSVPVRNRKDLPQYQLQQTFIPLRSASTVRIGQQPQETAATSTVPHLHNKSRVETVSAKLVHDEPQKQQTHSEPQVKANTISPSEQTQVPKQLVSSQHSSGNSQQFKLVSQPVLQQTRSLERVLEMKPAFKEQQTRSLERLLVMNSATNGEQTRSLERILAKNLSIKDNQHNQVPLGRKRPVFASQLSHNKQHTVISNGPGFIQTPFERACSSRSPVGQQCKNKKYLGRARTVKPVFQSKNERVSVVLRPADYETPIKTTDV